MTMFTVFAVQLHDDKVGLPMHEGQISSDAAIFHANECVIDNSNGDRIAFAGSFNSMGEPLDNTSHKP